jgi:hypothetical protein
MKLAVWIREAIRTAAVADLAKIGEPSPFLPKPREPEK